jgi:hypothetical protein
MSTFENTYAIKAQRKSSKSDLDFFPTPPWATRALCEKLGNTSQLSVWEPACGAGHMARPLSECFRRVYVSDIKDYGYPDTKVENFLDESLFFADWVITNPPFNRAAEFVSLSLARSAIGVAFLVRSAFLETKDRYETIYSKIPPTYVYQFVERVPMTKGRCQRRSSTATAYCWLVWYHDQVGNETRLRWIAPCRKRLERDGDYDDDVV